MSALIVTKLREFGMLSPRQIEILEAAIQLTSESGIQKLTIRNVAAKIGVTEPALYRHFASKHELLVAILAYLQQQIAPNFQGFIHPKGSPSEQFKQFLENLIVSTTQEECMQELQSEIINCSDLNEPLVEMEKDDILEYYGEILGDPLVDSNRSS